MATKSRSKGRNPIDKMVDASFHRFLLPVSADKYIGSKCDPLF